jgi:hypothetical protein
VAPHESVTRLRITESASYAIRLPLPAMSLADRLKLVLRVGRGDRDAAASGQDGHGNHQEACVPQAPDNRQSLKEHRRALPQAEQTKASLRPVNPESSVAPGGRSRRSNRGRIAQGWRFGHRRPRPTSRLTHQEQPRSEVRRPRDRLAVRCVRVCHALASSSLLDGVSQDVTQTISQGLGDCPPLRGTCLFLS